MRRRIMPLLNTILLVIFVSYVQLQERNNGDNRCLTLDKHGNCSCCKSGFRGQTCNDICEHCLSRLGTGQSCTYFCKTGYYGKTCDKPCPETCAPSISGPHLCKEKYGLPFCVKCFPGSHGKHCDQICDENCLNRKCYRTDGKCLRCSSNEFYGDHCRLPCSQECVSGTCNRTGHCTHGCKFGIYGERCESLCGSNCQHGKCTSHRNHAYNCTKGCHGGYWGTSCLEKCPNHCTECEQQSGRCTLCMDNYVQKLETEECVKVKEGKPAVADGSNLVMVVIIVIVVIVVIIISGIIIMVIWTKRRHRHRGRSAEEYGLLSCFSDNNTQQEHTPLLQPVNQGGGEGVRNADLVDLQIQDIQDMFIETSIYDSVEENLKSNGHVTISGASGEGKTSMALMLGNDYKKKGYQLVFVTDPMKYKMEIVKGRKTFCIFDDIFRPEGLLDTSKLKEVLLFVELYLKQAKEKEDIQSEDRQEKYELNLMVVFTSKTHNLTSGISQLPECKHFLNSSVVEVTASGYSQIDRERIFFKHKQMQNINESMPVEEICNLKVFPFGFPLLCLMYFKLLYSKGIDVLSFFREPITFLESEIMSIIKSKNKKSAALILMMLCEDGINVFHLDNESGDTMLDTVFQKRVKKVQNLIKLHNRADIADAARSFQGTLFTKGDIMYFSHSAITYACAFVILDVFPIFLLRNGSIKFLYERIHPVLSDSTMIDRKKNTIMISQKYSDIIVERLAEEIEKGEYSMTISHPILRNKDVVEKLFIKLDSPSVYFHARYNHKCFLHWAVRSQSLCLIQNILKIESNFSPEEIQQACEACATCGNIIVLKLIFEQFTSKINETVVINVALAVAYTGNSEMFECLPLNGQNPKLSLSFTSQGHNMLQAACIGGSTQIVGRVLQWIDIDSQDQHGQTAIMLAVLGGKKEEVTFLNEMGANLTLRNNKGDTVFHLASQVGIRSIVEHLLPSFDINSPGQNGRTPVMMAAYRCNKEVFDLLVTQGADLILTDNYSGTVLSRACWGGNTSIVEHLLPLFDINSPANNGWTPVMIAAYIGKKEIFDLLVTKGADLTLIDNCGSTVLHQACWGGNTSIVEHLLLSLDINSRGKNGLTPVMNAAYSGKKEMVELLVTKEADLTLTDNYGNTVLHCTCWGGKTSIVEHLLTSFDINSRGGNDRTPVMIAAYTGKKEIFDLLETKGADLTLTDKYGGTVLHRACWGGNTSIVEHLLQLFDMKSPAHNGWTPVMIAAYIGKKEIFDLLVTKGADITLTDNNGNTVLHHACWGGNTSIVEHLLPLFDINSLGQNGLTPVMNAANSGKKEVFELLVTKGADLTLTNKSGYSVLHRACEGGNTSIVEHILSIFDINSKGGNDRTPVMIAAFSGNKDIFQLLVTKRADLTLIDNNGNTAFHLACWGGNTSIVEHLSPLFDINSPANNGWTPVMIAAYIGKKVLFDLLVTKGADLKLIDNCGSTVLHQACWGGNTSIVEHLLPLFDINSLGQNGVSPIMCAADSGKKEVFDLLVNKGADLTLTDNNGNTVLYQACWGGNTSIVEHLVQSFDINSRGGNDRTPVMIAASSGNKDIFQLLVTKRADLALIDNNGNTAFHLACWGGNTSIVEHLSPLFDINSPANNEWTPVMIAAYIGKKEIFDLLVTKGADPTLTDNNGNTVLHHACWGGNTSIVEHLLPLFDINSLGQNGLTPVMNAADSGKKEVFDLLVTKGADLTLTDNHGNTVLYFACWGGNTSIVEHVLPLFDINSRGQNGLTPVMNAADSGTKEVFELLVTKEADLTLTDNYGNTVLHHACWGENRSIVEHLLPLFDINSLGQNGLTSVMNAAYSGKKEVFELLVTKGADLTLTDKCGNTVLHCACEGGNRSIVEHLLTSFDINNRGQNGLTPVMNAAYTGKKEIFDLLVTKGADLTLTNKCGNTVLHCACEGGNTSIVEHLLPLFDINSRGKNGLTPVMIAAYTGKKEIFELLVTKEADLTLTDTCGNTVLHLACWGGNVAIVKFTLPLFNINKRGRTGHTPLMMAVCSGHMEVFDFLLSNHADVTLKNDDGDGLLHLAHYNGDLDMVKHVLPYFDSKLRNKQELTPAMGAAVKR